MVSQLVNYADNLRVNLQNLFVRAFKFRYTKLYPVQLEYFERGKMPLWQPLPGCQGELV